MCVYLYIYLNNYKLFFICFCSVCALINRWIIIFNDLHYVRIFTHMYMYIQSNILYFIYVMYIRTRMHVFSLTDMSIQRCIFHILSLLTYLCLFCGTISLSRCTDNETRHCNVKCACTPIDARAPRHGAWGNVRRVIMSLQCRRTQTYVRSECTNFAHVI